MPRWLCRLLGGHRWPAEWRLEPAFIGAAVRAVYWLRICPRCQARDRRWFSVAKPHDPHRLIPVRRYLARAATEPPDPLSLPQEAMRKTARRLAG